MASEQAIPSASGVHGSWHNQETAIILAGLYTFSSNKFFERLNECHGLVFDYTGEIIRWEDDSENYDGWGDPPFKGFRIVLWDSATDPLQTKMFDSGEQALCYAYLTEKNAQEVIGWVKYFWMDKRIITLIEREFGLTDS